MDRTLVHATFVMGYGEIAHEKQAASLNTPH